MTASRQAALAIASACRRLFVVSSFSKYFNMTGWRLGWVVAPERHVRDLEKLAQNLYISPPTAVAARGARVLPAGDARASSKSGAQRVSRSRAISWFPRCASWASAIPVMPTGGFFVYADSSRVRRPTAQALLPRRCSKAPASRSRRASTSAATAREAHVRFAYTIGMAKLEDGIERLRRFSSALTHDGRAGSFRAPGCDHGTVAAQSPALLYRI